LYYTSQTRTFKTIAAELKSVQQRAATSSVSDEFVSLVVQGIVDGFRRLDALPRVNHFWDRSNRRPTLGKLAEFADYGLRDDPTNVSALRSAIAFQILTYQNFHPGFWHRVHSTGNLHVSWPIYAALLLVVDDFQAKNLLIFLKATGLCDEAKTTLDRLTDSHDRSVSEWARRIIDRCGDTGIHRMTPVSWN
jgi:hypothetical protein